MPSKIRKFKICKCGEEMGDVYSVRCSNCYIKILKSRPREPWKPRFLKYIKKTPTCWLWIASKDNGGYGTLGRDGKLEKAHRLSWEFYNGLIPKGMNVLHKCDVRDCVNPEHLWLGTQFDNMQDAVKKGRMNFNPPKGPSHYRWKPELHSAKL